MNKIREVIKNKNKIEKARKLRRKNELALLKNNSAFKAKLYDELKHIEIILNDRDIDAVIITVPDKVLNNFLNAIYSDDLAGYNIQQGETPNKFYIREKIISL